MPMIWVWEGDQAGVVACFGGWGHAYCLSHTSFATNKGWNKSFIPLAGPKRSLAAVWRESDGRLPFRGSPAKRLSTQQGNRAGQGRRGSTRDEALMSWQLGASLSFSSSTNRGTIHSDLTSTDISLPSSAVPSARQESNQNHSFVSASTSLEDGQGSAKTEGH